MAVQQKPAAGSDGAPEPLPAKKSKKPIIMIALALVVFGGAFAFVHFTMAKDHGKKGPVKVEVGDIVPLDEFLINTADTPGDHYLKTTIALGLIKGKSADDFKNKVPIARDAIIMVLTTKDMADLRSEKGKDDLKLELCDKINQALGDKTIAQVYLESFATQ